MWTKYAITFTKSGDCEFKFDRRTNNIIVALWYLLILSIQYPIVDFSIRRGYVECSECNVDYCYKSISCGKNK